MDMSLRDQIRENTKDVGARIRDARVLKRLSQSNLAAALGVTFQQIQKYENGKNRISVSTLIAIADTLQTDIGFFLPRHLLPAGRADLDIARREVSASLTAINDAIAVLSDHRIRLDAALARLGTPES